MRPYTVYVPPYERKGSKNATSDENLVLGLKLEVAVTWCSLVAIILCWGQFGSHRLCVLVCIVFPYGYISYIN
jgi:hypothetical protein